MCQQSTDFHFPDLDTQLRVIQQHALRANAQRKQAERNSNDGGKLIWPPGTAFVLRSIIPILKLTLNCSYFFLIIKQRKKRLPLWHARGKVN